VQTTAAGLKACRHHVDSLAIFSTEKINAASACFIYAGNDGKDQLISKSTPLLKRQFG